jgi:hypothetical protein
MKKSFPNYIMTTEKFATDQTVHYLFKLIGKGRYVIHKRQRENQGWENIESNGEDSGGTPWTFELITTHTLTADWEAYNGDEIELFGILL